MSLTQRQPCKRSFGPVQHPYLEANLQILTKLAAAAQLAVDALVHEAVEFVGAVAAVVVAVAQQRLVNAVPIAAHVGSVVALLLCVAT